VIQEPASLLLLLGLLSVLGVAVAKAVAFYRRWELARAQAAASAQKCQRLEEALTRTANCYDGLFEHLGLGLFQTTLDGHLTRVNRALASNAGYESSEEMLESVEAADRRFYIPEFYQRASCRIDVLRRLAENSSPLSYEIEFPRKAGDPITAQVTLRLVDGGQAGFYLEGSLEDVTERKRVLEYAEMQRDLGIQLSATSSLSQALPLCLQAAIRASGMDSGEIYLADSASDLTILAQCHGYRPECIAGLKSEARSNPEALRDIKAPSYDGGLPCEAGRRNGCERALGARAVIPILHETHVIGWLVMRSHAWQRVPAFSRTALETIAAQIGSSIVRLQAEEALVASQQELKSLFDSLNDFLVVVDNRGRILDANRAMIETSGYSREELRGMLVTSLYPLQLQLGAMSSGVLGEELSFVSAPLMTKDGRVIPVETRLGLGSWDGQSVIIGLGRDLTDRRLAEERSASLREKIALLQEIHHRIKNNLQIICSLLSLQARRLGDGPASVAFAESRARVRAIALLHEKLYQSRDLSRIELGEYLGALVEDVLRAYQKPEIRLRLQAAPAWLDQETVMPCGLIVNELVTNSCKYAFPESNSGEIYLSVDRVSEGEVCLQLADNGIGLPAGLDPRKTKSLGLQLVSDMVAQMKGTWTVASNGGTRYRITFPAKPNDG
jgi:PAS domain S-box-containing protein